jgi:hypothetical protein
MKSLRSAIFAADGRIPAVVRVLVCERCDAL